VEEGYHFQCRLGTFHPFVTYPSSFAIFAPGACHRTAAGKGLLQGVTGEHSEENGDSSLRAQAGKGQTYSPIDVLIVSGFPFDNRHKT
jgi:hypothetical protein